MKLTNVTFNVGRADWNSYNRFRLKLLIIPFSDQQEAAKELRDKVVEDNKVMILQPAPDGQGMVVVEW